MSTVVMYHKAASHMYPTKSLQNPSASSSAIFVSLRFGAPVFPSSPRLQGSQIRNRDRAMATELDLSSHDTPSLEKIQLSEIKDVKPSQVGNATGLGPMTPIADRGNREALVGSDTPITWVSSPLTVVACKSSGSENTDSDSVHRTPKRRVFDPFAPGPDELMFAPRKKPLEESRSRTMRRLNFQSCGDFMEDVGENDLEDGIHEEKFLESVYETYLDAIVSKQAEGILAESPELELELCNGFKTPTASPLLKGIAETCPRAPIKPAAKLRSLVSVGICRKLDF